jgi:pyrroloquinoline quinone (PQQ) biosynthesis protein C
MTDVMPPDDFMAEMWDYANEVPMEQHPWFDGILHHRWTPEQIILGEIQHYHRVRTNPIHWGYILVNAVAEKRYEHMDAVLDNFAEEFARPRTHVDVMLQLLEEGGISREQADATDSAPGTMAAIEMINGCCQHRSSLEGLAMLSLVESQHAVVAAKVYREMTGHYGFSPRAAETYAVHGEQDVEHGARQIEVIRAAATDANTQERVRQAVRLGITAYTLEWDGHVQAMTGRREFWSGTGAVRLRQPMVRLAGTVRPMGSAAA